MTDPTRSPEQFDRPHAVAYGELIAFAAGDHGQSNPGAIAAHVATCAACAATVARFRRVRQTVRADALLAPSPAALARVRGLARGVRPVERQSTLKVVPLRRLVAALTFDGLARPALAGLRGASEGYQLAYAVEGLEVDLEVSPEPAVVYDRPAAGARWQIIGQVAGSTGHAGAGVVLAAPGRDDPVVEVATDEDGIFAFEATTGTYDLLLRLPEGVLVLPSLELGRNT